MPKPHHPEGKTSTISNTSYYVEKSFLDSEDPNTKVEFVDRSSIIKRIDEDNFLNHYKYYSSQVDQRVFHIMDGTPVTIQDSHPEYEIPVDVLKDNQSIIVHFDINEN